MKLCYENWSSEIFYGFYYSSYSPEELIEDETGCNSLPQDYEFDMIPGTYDKFKDDVGNYFVESLKNNLYEHDVIKGVDFDHVWSPQYYNYFTDKVNINMNVDLRKLKKYCFNTHKKEFDKYLHDKWSSCDGFVSFIPNNLYGFKLVYDSGKTETIVSVMVEFYLLTLIDFEFVNMDVYETAREHFFKYLCLYNCNTHKYYDYEYDDTIDKVIPIKEIA